MNGKFLKTILWTVLWTLLVGSYGWATWGLNALGKEVITNDRINTIAHTEMRAYFLIIQKDMGSIQRELGEISGFLKINKFGSNKGSVKNESLF